MVVFCFWSLASTSTEDNPRTSIFYLNLKNSPHSKASFFSFVLSNSISFQLLSNQGPSSSHMTSDWPVIGQFSSIGSLGTEPNKWLTSEWLQSFSQCRKSSTGNLLQRNAKAKINLVRLLEAYVPKCSSKVSKNT